MHNPAKLAEGLAEGWARAQTKKQTHCRVIRRVACLVHTALYRPFRIGRFFWINSSWPARKKQKPLLASARAFQGLWPPASTPATPTIQGYNHDREPYQYRQKGIRKGSVEKAAPRPSRRPCPCRRSLHGARHGDCQRGPGPLPLYQTQQALPPVQTSQIQPLHRSYPSWPRQKL